MHRFMEWTFASIRLVGDLHFLGYPHSFIGDPPIFIGDSNENLGVSNENMNLVASLFYSQVLEEQIYPVPYLK